MAAFRRSDEADNAYKRLSASSKAVIDKASANRTNWQRLVRKVGPERAVEHVETAGMMGLVGAAEGVLDVAMKDFGLGMTDAEETRGDIDALDTHFEARIIELHDAIAEASSCDESAAVGVYGLGYYVSMFEVAAAIIDGSLSDDRRDQWSAEKRVWDRTCDSWDNVSGRNALPLVGD